MGISHAEMVQVYKNRNYGLNAAEINSSVKSDREVISFCDRKKALVSVASYNAWLDEMERLGS